MTTRLITVDALIYEKLRGQKRSKKYIKVNTVGSHLPKFLDLIGNKESPTGIRFHYLILVKSPKIWVNDPVTTSPTIVGGIVVNFTAMIRRCPTLE